MTLRQSKSVAVALAWFVLVGCADPTVKDEMSPKEYIKATATSLASLNNRPEPTVEKLAQLGIVYERRGPGGECGSDPLIHGPQDHCHPKYRLFGQIQDRLMDVLSKGGEQLSKEDAERVALAAFWCATYTYMDRVDDIEVWPETGPWRDRLITMKQTGSVLTGEGGMSRAIAAVTGLSLKHNSLIQMVRWVDYGARIDQKIDNVAREKDE